MATSDETAFLASSKAANEEQGVLEGANHGAAATESNNTSVEYDPAQAVPAVPSVSSFSPIAQESSIHQTPSSALLNETMSTSTLLDVSSDVVPTVQDPLATDKSNRQSESRSMSRAASSDTAQILPPDPSISDPSLAQTQGPAVNGIETNSAVQEPSLPLPTTSLNPDDVAPTPGSAEPSTTLMQNGDHYTAADPLSNTSTNMAPGENTLADTMADSTNASHTTAAPAQKQEATAPTSSLPKARLPHDTIGILEDRIKEDSRGDMDAWLNLIAEYRKRGKVDEARSVYERFFNVFPAAVRSCYLSSQCE